MQKECSDIISWDLIAIGVEVNEPKHFSSFKEWAENWFQVNEIDEFLDQHPIVMADHEQDPTGQSQLVIESEEDSSDNDAQTLDEHDPEDTFQGKHNIAPRFIQACIDKNIEDLCLAFGVHVIHFDDQAPSSSLSQLTHKEVIHQMMGHLSLKHTETTMKSYANYSNTFLLWLYSREGYEDKWREGHDLLIDSSSVYRFMQEYYNGDTRADGTQPWIVDVLKSNESYQMTTPHHPKRIFVTTLKKMRAALGKWQECQCLILQREVEFPIRSDLMIRGLIKQASTSHPQEAQGAFLDRHRRVHFADFDLNKKEKEQEYYLKQGGSEDIRDRAMMLTSVFSISRFSDTSRWDLCDCFRISYPKEILGMSAQDMDCLYIIQGESKTRADELNENWNCISRGRHVSQCPIGALAFYLVNRFHCELESFPPIHKSKHEWYTIKLFPARDDRTRAIASTSGYTRKKKMMKVVNTHGKAVLHDDRRFGAFYATLRGVSKTGISDLGFWNTCVQSRYSRVHEPKTLIRMAGFKCEAEYYLPRNVLDPTKCNDPDITQFVNSIFPQIDNQEWKDLMKQKLIGSDSDTAATHVAEVLRMLRRIFVQDIYYYFQTNPELKIFSSYLFKDNANGVKKWMKLQSEVMEEIAQLQAGAGTSAPQMLASDSKKVGSVVSLHDDPPSGYKIIQIEGSNSLGFLTEEGETLPSTTQTGILHNVPAMQSLANDVDKIMKSLHSLWAAVEHNSVAISEMKDMVGSLSKQIQDQSLKAQVQLELQQPIEIDEQESTTIQKDQHEKYPFTNLPYYQEQCTNFESNSGDYQLTYLPALSKTSLTEIYHEWNTEVSIGMKKLPPLKELEHRRITKTEMYKDPKNRGLKSNIFRRKTLVDYIVDQASQKYGINPTNEQCLKTIKAIEKQQVELDGERWTINGLFERIKGYKSKQNR